jgi:hypothetical protein
MWSMKVSIVIPCYNEKDTIEQMLMRFARRLLRAEKSSSWMTARKTGRRLGADKNLLFWYRELYSDQFKSFPDPAALSILEVGSGTSPLKQFHSNVLTSDVLDLDISILCLIATKSTN